MFDRKITTHVENDRQPELYASLDEDGINNEVLLAVVIDLLEGFQSGPFACEEKAFALKKAKDALNALHSRTRERVARGVENKHEK